MVTEETILGREEYKQHARHIAEKQGIMNSPEIRAEAYVLECETYFENIREIYKELAEEAKYKNSKRNKRTFPAAEILVDNYYIVLSKMNDVKSVMSGSGMKTLSERIIYIAGEITAHCDYALDKNKIMDFISSYQEIAYLTSEELRWLGAILKTQLIKRISNLSNSIIEIKQQRDVADRLINLRNAGKVIQKDPKKESALIEHFSYKMKSERESYLKFREIVNRKYAAMDLSLDELIKFENSRQSSIQVSLSNAIGSLRELDKIDFQELFENLSYLEKILSEDPSGIYGRMDEESKDYYRKTLEKEAKKQNVSEIFLAKNALEKAKSEKEHIGRFIIKEKREAGKELMAYKAAIMSTSVIGTFFVFLYVYTRGESGKLFYALLAAAAVFPVLLDIFTQIIRKSFMSILKPAKLPGLDFKDGIPPECAVMVIIPTLLSSEKRTCELFKHMEALYSINSGENIYFAIVGDLSDSDKEFLEQDEAIERAGVEKTAELNHKYGDKFFFYLRKRTYNEKQKRWSGWERKRGAIIEFNRYLKTNEDIPKIKYVITLDADTNLTIGAVNKLVGIAAHPLNRPVVDKKKGCVVDGYGIFQTAVTTDIESSGKSLFSKIFAGQGGTETYSIKISDLYMDMCGEGIYTGKGIYDLDIFNMLLEDAIPENLVLSHDLLEGSYLRTGFINDMQMIDSFPAKYNSYAMRLHRWVRGDWQIIGWLFPKVKNRMGEKIKNPLNSLSKWKIWDNLRRSWLEPSIFIMLLLGMFVLPGSKNLWIVLTLASFFILPVTGIAEMCVNGFNNPQNKRYLTFAHIISGLSGLWLQKLIGLVFLPYTACLMMGAIFKTLYRLVITKEKMLEWVTAADMESILKGSVKSYVYMMKSCIIWGIVMFFTGNIFMYALGVLWILAPFTAWYISRPIAKKDIKKELSKEEIESVRKDAELMWGFYEKYVTPLDNFLPPDNVQFDPVYNVAHRTSPTNIGFYLLSTIGACDMGLITKDEACERIKATLGTLERMEKWNGHLYNWYDTISLAPLRPYYISTVDSGNLQGYLLTVAQALKEFGKEYSDTASICENFAESMDFEPLYDKERNLFSIGFNIEDGRLTNSHYDLLVSEARQTSLLSVARRCVPEKHWKYLGRRPVTVKGHIGLASWTGTAFEFLMPSLIIKTWEGSLIEEAVLTCVLAQTTYVKSGTRPWGISESGFYEFDINLNYQYKAFGLPRLGLKKGLENEFVIAPYGSILAIGIEPKKVSENLKLLKQLGAYGEFGYYEALDYTPSRTNGEKYKIVKSYMAHHVGMSFIAIHNFLFDDLMKERFHSLPYIKGSEYLLCEKAPVSGTPQNDTVTGELRAKTKNTKEEDVPFTKTITGIPLKNKMPDCALMSNGRYSVFINNFGTGFSKLEGKLLYGIDFDGRDYHSKFFCFIKNIDGGEAFSLYAMSKNDLPENIEEDLKKPDRYEMAFGGEKTIFSRFDGQIECVTSITAAAEDNVEIRKTQVINHGDTGLILEINTGISFALCSEADYMAHPAYNNLFIKTEFISGCDLVIAAKKPKESEKPYVYGFLAMPINENRKGAEIIDDLKYEGEFESVLLKRRVSLEPGACLEFSCIMGISDEREAAVKAADKYDDFANAERAFKLASLKNGWESEEFALELLPHLFYPSEAKKKFEHFKEKCSISRNDLWALGISLDNPVVLSFVDPSFGEDWIEKLVDAKNFLEMKGVIFDLVFVAEDDGGYMQPVYNMIRGVVGMSGNKNHIFIFRGNDIGERLKTGLIVFAAAVFNNEIFDLKKLSRYDVFMEDVSQDFGENLPENFLGGSRIFDIKELGAPVFDNGVGFFTEDGMEYVIYGNPPRPWINVIASPNFGFTTDSFFQGCVWADNSRENRLTPWHNDEKIFSRGEAFIAEDILTGERINLFDERVPHVTRHGIGYTVYEFSFEKADLSIMVMCDFKNPVKIMEIRVRNKSDGQINIKFRYEPRPVIGVSPIKTFRHLLKTENTGKGFVCVRNVLPENAYGSWENLLVYSGEKELSISPGAKGETSIIMGKAAGYENAEKYFFDEKYLCGYSSRDYYRDMLANVKVYSDDESFRFMFGGRLIYQVLSCRMYGRTAFFQSGGAFGFRDQLQDSIVMISYDSEITKEQILRCCRHQFKEGDVQHWWHEPDGKGIRSRYSDDLLWLPYVVSEYVKKTSDFSILTLCENFLESPVLSENEKERYEQPAVSSEKGTVYNHCIRAVKHSLRFGIHSLPLIGGGDWNDGMNNIGDSENGESVWLGWFLLCVMNRLLKFCEYMGDEENFQIFSDEITRLLSVMDSSAYDGAWYKRAFFKSGEPLGSAVNSECSIDSISQSWGAIAICEILDSDFLKRGQISFTEEQISLYKAHLIKAMDSLERYLADYQAGIVKLLAPPFVSSVPDPGYIMGYTAGVRENGGQYTHAAVWYVKGLLCMSKLIPERHDEYVNKALRTINMLNPVNHTRTQFEVSVYRGEPYAVAADVYFDPAGKFTGRAGWTWYTGAAGWMQQIAEEIVAEYESNN